MEEKSEVNFNFNGSLMKNTKVISMSKSCFTDSKARQKSMSVDNLTIRKEIMQCKKTKSFNKISSVLTFEIVVFEKLVEKYGFDDVFYEYGLHPYDERYPFNCDFYIKSLDLFIELNIRPCHGGSWYLDSNDDKLRLSHLKESPKKSAKKTILTWSEKDVDKRRFSKKNNLNYLVFWKSDLSDFFSWYYDFDCDYMKFTEKFKENTYI